MAKPPSNAAHLLRLWSISAAMLAFAAFMVIASVRRGDGGVAYVVAAVFASMTALVWFVRRRVLRGLARDFLAPGPEALIARSQRALSRARVPHARELLALGMAAARAYYGQFGRARDELDEIVWDAVPPLYLGSAQQVRALIHYLSGDDPEAGLRLARQAVQATQVPRFTPGAKTSARVGATYVDIGRVLTEAPNAELAELLAARAAVAGTPQERLLTAWGAAVAQQALGNAERADALFAQLRTLAPHCRPLHAPPPLAPAGSAQAQSASDEHGMCARHPQLPASGRCLRCGSFACDACRRPISPAAVICADCHERYASLREEHVRAESHLRAAGLLAQGLAVVIAVSGFAGAFAAPAASRIAVLWFAAAWALFAWWGGRSLRRLDLRSPLPVLLLLLMSIIPVGTLMGAYLLWLSYGPSGRAIRTLDYQRALAVTPELQPRANRGLLALALGALLANIALFALLLIAP